MGNKQTPKLFIKTDSNTYQPGDTVTGSVYAHLPTNLATEGLWLNIIGYESCSRVTSMTTPKCNAGHHDYFNYLVPLGTWADRGLTAGDYSFPFVFELPKNIPGSFSASQKGISAEICYKIAAAFKGTGVSDEFSLVVVQPTVEMLKPDQQLVSLAVRYLGCISRGQVSMTATFPDRYLEIGGTARVFIGLDNRVSGRTIPHITCSLWRKLEITTNKGKRFGVDELINSIRLPGVPGQGSLLTSNDFELTLSLQESKDSRPKSSIEGQMICCSYYLEISASLERWLCFSSEPLIARCAVNIRQREVLIRESPELPSRWNPQIMPVANLCSPSRIHLSSTFTDN